MAETDPSEQMMIAYYDGEREALVEKARTGAIKEVEALNGKFYTLPLSGGEEIPVAFSNDHIVIRSGDTVLFKREKPDGKYWEGQIIVGDLAIDSGNGEVEFHSPRTSDLSAIRMQDASANLSAMSRARLVSATIGK